MAPVAPPAPVVLNGLHPGVQAVVSTRAHGDFRIDQPPASLDRRRAALVDRPWMWVRQVHGGAVLDVVAAGLATVRGTEADGMVTADAAVALAIATADCAPVMFSTAEGLVGAAHVGWRGLDAGIIATTAAVLRRRGATDIRASLGPCVGPCCYAFGEDDLHRLTARWGAGVRGVTSDGRPALDLRAAVGAVCAAAAVELVDTMPACTGCEAERFFSHRARQEPQRMATVIWRDG